jgi:hypothetical protein
MAMDVDVDQWKRLNGSYRKRLAHYTGRQSNWQNNRSQKDTDALGTGAVMRMALVAVRGGIRLTLE